MNTEKIRLENLPPCNIADVTKVSFETNHTDDKMTGTSQDRCIYDSTEGKNSEKEQTTQVQVTSPHETTKVKVSTDSTHVAKKGRPKKRIAKTLERQVSKHKVAKMQQDNSSPAIIRMEDIPITSVPMPSAYKFPFEKLNIKTEKLSKFKMTTFWPRAERKINCKNKLKFVNTSSEITDISSYKKDTGEPHTATVQLGDDRVQRPRTEEKLDISAPDPKHLGNMFIPAPILLLPIIPPITITNANRMLIPTSMNIQYPIIDKNINTNN